MRVEQRQRCSWSIISDGERRDLRRSDRATTVWLLEWPRVQVWSGWRIATDRRRRWRTNYPRLLSRMRIRVRAVMNHRTSKIPAASSRLTTVRYPPDGLRTTLSLDPAMRQPGEAGSGGEAVESEPGIVFRDLLLMDIPMPDMNGGEATRNIVESSLTRTC